MLADRLSEFFKILHVGRENGVRLPRAGDARSKIFLYTFYKVQFYKIIHRDCNRITE